jgi:hypothetical protein
VAPEFLEKLESEESAGRRRSEEIDGEQVKTDKSVATSRRGRMLSWQAAVTARLRTRRVTVTAEMCNSHNADF